MAGVKPSQTFLGLSAKTSAIFLLTTFNLGIKRNQTTTNNFFTTSDWHLLASTMICNPEEESLIFTIFTLIFALKLQRKYVKPTTNHTSRLRHTSNTNSIFPLNEKNNPKLQNNLTGNMSLVS